MSVFDGLRKWFGGGKTNGATCSSCVVDGVTLVNARGGRSNPREALGLLIRVSRFASREKMAIQVILEGEPLHRAPDGEEFQGITVSYEKDYAACKDRIFRLAVKGSAGIVVTQDSDLAQRVLACGGEVLRCSTFRKAMDNDGGGGEPNRGQDRSRNPRRDRDRDRDKDRNRNPRRDKDRRPQPSDAPAGDGAANAPSADSAPRGQSEDRQSGPSGQSSVRDLVDLVE